MYAGIALSGIACLLESICSTGRAISATSLMFSAEPAAPEDDLSGEPPGFFGCEKGTDQPDVFWHAGSTQRSLRFDRVGDLLVGFHVTRTLGVDYARVDEFPADVRRSKFVREPTGNAVHRPLRCRVDRRCGRSQSACYRADVDDAAALFAKLLCRTFGSKKKSEYIRVELAIELLFGYVLQRQIGEDAGIVNEYVHIAELLLGLAEEPINVFGRGHASLHSDGLSAGRFDLFNDTILPVSIRGVVDYDDGPLLRHRQREPCPDPFLHSCHYSYLPCHL